jgi:hypothetical protein
MAAFSENIHAFRSELPMIDESYVVQLGRILQEPKVLVFDAGMIHVQRS